MATNIKTWSKTLVTTGGEADADNSNRKMLFDLVGTLLNSGGWSHIASCDSAATSTSVNKWDSKTDLVWNTAGNAHSWIVIQNNTIASGLQICIDLKYVYTTSEYADVVISLSGFDGGSTTARPVGIIEQKVNTNYWGGSAAGTTRSYNFLQSSDGNCQRIFFYGNSARTGFWWIDNLNSAHADWTDPFVIKVSGTDTDYTNLSPTTDNSFYTIIDNFVVPISCGFLVVGNSPNYNIGSYSVFNTGDYSGNYIKFPIYALSFSTVRPGILGTFFDAWFTEDSLADLDYFPDAGTKVQVILGDVAFGNDGATFAWT